jgi:hypothetical protein
MATEAAQADRPAGFGFAGYLGQVKLVESLALGEKHRDVGHCIASC